MKRSAFAIGCLCILTSLLVSSTVTHAQQRQPVSLRINLGDVLEFGSDTSVEHPEFSWYMTQNQQFVEAQRGRAFQKRLAAAGTYNLDVSIKNEEATQSDFQSFAVTVLEQARTLPPIAPASSGTIVPRLITEPAMNSDGSISLPPQGGVLMIDASQSTGQITQFAMDMDTSKDSDNNGNASDDTDNADTFGLQDGTPFRYFIKPGNTQRNVIVRLSGNGTVPVTAQFSLRFDGQEVLPLPGSGAPIDITARQNGLVTDLTAALPAETAMRPVLFTWDFGDGARSLLTRPVHTYTRAGTYTVMLTVTDITNGQVLYSSQRALTVEENSGSVQSSSSSSVSSTDGKSSIPWKAILILLMLIVLAIVAFIALLWFKNRMTGTIQKKLETAEKKLFEEKKAATNGTPPPMQLKKPVTITQDQKPQMVKKEEQIIADREQSKTEFKKTEPPVAAASNGPVPSWLKNAPAETQRAPTEALKPAPAPSQKPVPPPAPRAAPVTPSPLAVNPPKQAPVTPPPPSAMPPQKSAPPAPAPKPQPTPAAPKPAPLPKPEQPAVQKIATPTPAPIPESQKAPVTEQPKPALEEPEKPIAFIRAESLEKKEEPPVQP
jgi:PKD repeat protein